MNEYIASANVSQICPPADKKTFIWRWVPAFVHPELRAIAITLYPGLLLDVAYFRFFQECCFPTQFEFATGNTMIPWQVLNIIEYGEHRSTSNGSRFLERYMRDVNHYPEITEYSRPRHGMLGLTRTIGAKNFHPEFETALQYHLSYPSARKDGVNFVTGKSYDPKYTQKRLHIDAAEHVQDINKQVMRPTSQREVSAALLSYLNNLSIRFFSEAIEKYGKQAEERARQYSDERKNESRVSKREYALLQNMQLRSMPKPFYRVIEHSYRLFPVGTTLCGIPRELRKIYLQDCTTFDMVSAQLAIIVKEWDIPEGEVYLQGKKKIWQELANWIGIELTDNVKDILKHAVYKLVYGGSVKNVVEDLDLELGIGEKFTTHPLIAAIIKARDIQIDKIMKAGGATDCFGTWTEIPVEFNEEWQRNEKNPRSVLAQLSQAIEFKLLYPVFELAIDNKMQKERPDFEIVLYQFDGFTVRFHRHDRVWKKRIHEAFDAQARELGILTRLEEEERYNGE